MVSPRIATSLEAATDLEIHEGGTPRVIVPRPGPGDDSLLQTESSFEEQRFPRAQAALRRQDRIVGTGRRVRGRERDERRPRQQERRYRNNRKHDAPAVTLPAIPTLGRDSDSY